MLRLREVGSILGLSRWTLYRWIKAGKLAVLRLPSGHFRVPERELERIKNKMAQAHLSPSQDDRVE